RCPGWPATVLARPSPGRALAAGPAAADATALGGAAYAGSSGEVMPFAHMGKHAEFSREGFAHVGKPPEAFPAVGLGVVACAPERALACTSHSARHSRQPARKMPTGWSVPTTRCPISKYRSTTSIASMSGMAARIERR